MARDSLASKEKIDRNFTTLPKDSVPMRLTTIFLLLCATTALADTEKSGPDARTVQSFIQETSRTCTSRAARDCIDAGWKFVVVSPQHGLTLPELKSLRQRLGGWFSAYQDVLSPQDRGAVLVGLLMADGIGMERLHKAFDTDRNGRVSQRELLTDVTLDQRSLGAILTDVKAVNRKALATRLGLPPRMIEELFR